MVIKCYVKGCKEYFVKGGMVTFHIVPKDEKRRKIWEVALGREKLPGSARVCSKHFKAECFDRNKFGGTWLKEYAIPTVFNDSNVKQEPLSDVETSSSSLRDIPEKDLPENVQISNVESIADDRNNDKVHTTQISNVKSISSDRNDDEVHSTQVQISNVNSISSDGCNDEVDSTPDEKSTWKSHKSPDNNLHLGLEEKDRVFGSFVASELSGLHSCPTLYMKTKQSIIKVLAEARFELNLL